MTAPKKRKSLTRRKRARAHHVKTLPQIVKCSNCTKYKLPHNICPNCGFYNGQLVKAPKIRKSEN